MMFALLQQACQPFAERLTDAEISEQLLLLKGWSVENNHLCKAFTFKSHAKLMLFLQAVAWIAEQQNHHPAVEYVYNRCVLRLSTHDSNGISRNDVICAAKFDFLLLL